MITEKNEFDIDQTTQEWFKELAATHKFIRAVLVYEKTMGDVGLEQRADVVSELKRISSLENSTEKTLAEADLLVKLRSLLFIADSH